MVAYLKRKTKQFIESKNMYMALVIASFLESIIVPIPLEAVLIPLMQAKREKIWFLAFLATLGCVFGAIIGYGVGYFLFDQFAAHIFLLITKGKLDIYVPGRKCMRIYARRASRK